MLKGVSMNPVKSDYRNYDPSSKGRVRTTFYFMDKRYEVEAWYNAEVYATPEWLAMQSFDILESKCYDTLEDLFTEAVRLVKEHEDAYRVYGMCLTECVKGSSAKVVYF